MKKDNNQCFVNVSYKCNSNCISCIMEKHYHDDSSITPELIKEKTNEILKNSTHIEFNGGEPTLRKDIFELLSYAGSVRHDAEIGLMTNCRTFSIKKEAQKLKSLGLRNLKIITTIYGPNERIHDAITRTPGSFVQQIKGIKNLAGLGIKIELRIVINRINYRHLPDIARFIASNFRKTDFINVNIVSMKISGIAEKNISSAACRITDTVPYAEKAALILNNNCFEVKLFHFPHCILSDKMKLFSKGMTAEKDEIIFEDGCSECLERFRCSGIWKSYAKHFGTDEFNQIK